MGEGNCFIFHLTDQNELTSLVREASGTRYSWSREHLVAEVAKLTVYAFPIIAIFGGYAAMTSVLMYLAGIFVWRAYDQYIRPLILMKLGPGGSPLDDDKPITVVVDRSGISVERVDFDLRFPWRSVAAIKRVNNGTVVQINAVACYAFQTRLIPDGMTLDEFMRQLQTWKQEAPQ